VYTVRLTISQQIQKKEDWKMKKIIVLLLSVALLVTISVNFSYAAEKIRITEVGSRGCFVYPWTGGGAENDEFSIFSFPGCNGGGYGGIITAKTKIVTNLKGINKSTLNLLSGKEVVVFAKLREVGEGEGGKTYCDELYVFVPIIPRR
jgi:hypothetical protein